MSLIILVLDTANSGVGRGGGSCAGAPPPSEIKRMVIFDGAPPPPKRFLEPKNHSTTLKNVKNFRASGANSGWSPLPPNQNRTYATDC